MSKSIDSHILNDYVVLKQMGSGAYGHVWEVQQKKTQKHFALKKVFDAFRNSVDAQRTYREVSILNQINHENIIKLYSVIKSKNNKDLYLIFEFMEADLHSIVGSNILQKMHQVYVFFQILKALKYLHSSELIHRDLKPSNILLNSECAVKICDFGLVRTLNSHKQEENILSEQVATKWYRAPELLLGSRSYKKPVDVWSFGCIVAEILTGKPMFTGDSTLNQLQKIIQFTGKVQKQDIQSLDSPVAEQLITQIKVKKRSFRQYFSSVDPDYWEMLKGALQFNPNKRMTIDEILSLQLFDEFRQQISQLKLNIKVIKPALNDDMRYEVKVYRQKIYHDICIGNKLCQQNKRQYILSKQSKHLQHSKGSSQSKIKRRVVSQQKLKSTQNQSIQHRKMSAQSNTKSHKPINKITKCEKNVFEFYKRKELKYNHNKQSLKKTILVYKSMSQLKSRKKSPFYKRIEQMLKPFKSTINRSNKQKQIFDKDYLINKFAKNNIKKTEQQAKANPKRDQRLKVDRQNRQQKLGSQNKDKQFKQPYNGRLIKKIQSQGAKRFGNKASQNNVDKRHLLKNIGFA